MVCVCVCACVGRGIDTLAHFPLGGGNGGGSGAEI